MRLIDADALKEKVKKYHDMEDEHDGISEGREGALYDTLIDIDNAPTVDAIPVEWMREKMDGYAAKLKSTELAALVTVMQMWEQEAR